jgi:cytochrome c oxidase subunit IV
MTVSLVDITVNAFSLVVLMMILSAGEYVIVSGPGVNEGNIDRAYWVNQIVQWNLLLVTVIASFDLVYELWQVLKWRRSALVLS